MGRGSKAAKRLVNNKKVKVRTKSSVAPSGPASVGRTNRANTRSNFEKSSNSAPGRRSYEDKYRSHQEQRFFKRVRELVEQEKAKQPDVTVEAIRQRVASRINKRLDHLEKKYPGADRLELAILLTTPQDEQPLWFHAEKGEAMSKEDRDRVILEFRKQARLARVPPPLKAQNNQAHRALRRQTRLTFKQWEVAHLTFQGLDIKQIAAQLNISPRMVKTQLQAIRRKGNLTRNAEIVRWFLGY